jgi:pilus assembly protein CpaC
MKKHHIARTCWLCILTLSAVFGEVARAQTPPPQRATPLESPVTVVGPALELIIGKSKLLHSSPAIERVSVGNPTIADVTLISPTELYLLGKNYGSTNVVIWKKGGATTAIDVNVSIDADRMERKLRELLPEEKNIRVRPAADSVILTGAVTSAIKARYAEDIANAFVRDINKSLVLPVVAGDSKATTGANMAALSTGGTGSAKVVNLLQVTENQQVMLEVIVAEVSKTLLDKLGSNLNIASGSGMRYSIVSSLLSNGVGAISLTASNGNTLTLDAKREDGLIKVLAEPNIVAISGQEASFLAGGKIFIPVARTNLATGGSTITLEEKEYGVGLKFTPTVLEGGRIHLKVAPEVSELSQTGSPFTTTDGTTSVLPSVSTRRVQTTVQLMDGQSLAIAGLIKNNVSQTSRRTLLGDIPILGVLFRSSEFQNDRTELMFLITPRLVKPLEANISLPTDPWTPPSRQEFFLGGKLEGSKDAPTKVEPKP